MTIDEGASWVWAYREQLRLLDAFDAMGLQCTKLGWNDFAWNQFLNEYALGRGFHSELRTNRVAILDHLEPLFKRKLPTATTVSELSEMWSAGVRIVGALSKRKKKNGSDPGLWSFVSKLLWFYYPSQMTMYDTNARLALHRQTGRAVSPHRFLVEFDKLFTIVLPRIELAGTFSDRKYPYPRRVLDKWLWLKGSKDGGAARLHYFQLSLSLAPITCLPVVSGGSDH